MNDPASSESNIHAKTFISEQQMIGYIMKMIAAKKTNNSLMRKLLDEKSAENYASHNSERFPLDNQRAVKDLENLIANDTVTKEVVRGGQIVKVK